MGDTGRATDEDNSVDIGLVCTGEGSVGSLVSGLEKMEGKVEEEI
jgi:hypothetical protein